MNEKVEEQLTHLKDSERYNRYPTGYCPSILEAFDNQFTQHDQMVTLNIPEFSCLCEITKQPDYGKIYINYVPDKKLVESKAMKLYIFGFRNHSSFHEHSINTIAKDLMKLLDPYFLEVKGEFLPRGGISIDPCFIYGRRESKWEQFAQNRMLLRNSNQKEINNR